MNATGRIVGSMEMPQVTEFDTNHACMWTKPSRPLLKSYALDITPEAWTSRALDVNDAAQVVGYLYPQYAAVDK